MHIPSSEGKQDIPVATSWLSDAVVCKVIKPTWLLLYAKTF